MFETGSSRQIRSPPCSSTCRPDIQPVAKFAYLIGWRVASEVLPLEWRNVDFQGGEIRLDAGTTKNDEGRVFPMTTALRALLKDQARSHDTLRLAGTICPLVFHRRETQIKSFVKAWRDACCRAGCPGRLQHDLRRTAVRDFVRAGVSERVAMKLTGHKTRSVFERYNIVSDTDLRHAVEALNEKAQQHAGARSADRMTV